jgi:glutamate synthase domain-containing protein 1/glutamate synthase domain-containing protein 3
MSPNPSDTVRALIHSRRALAAGAPLPAATGSPEAEGGCGVIGFLASRPVAGRYLIEPCRQMRNRGNGKGGGIAAVGLFPEYREHYALHIAYIDPAVRPEVEQAFVEPLFDVAYAERQPSAEDHRRLGLEIRPPEVHRYFVRVKPERIETFLKESGLLQPEAAEDELVYQNSFRLNRQWYAGGRAQAFVLSHAKDLMILKGVGYAEEIAAYYRLEEVQAHGWIGHQRYPTRGRVWHPGGAHPFIGLAEALVHNGDFANYHSVTEYLGQRGIVPLFITDTEVSVLLFDLYDRMLGYPLAHTIEALAPTAERDFELLPKPLQRTYRAIRSSHLHGSPDGPWFFILLRNAHRGEGIQLIGITDTSMLRPQVFALYQDAELDLGVIASEKQAIDRLFVDLSRERTGVPTGADLYWNARGGSHSDGGAFVFSLKPGSEGRLQVRCADKFGKPIGVARPAAPVDLRAPEQPLQAEPEAWWRELTGRQRLTALDLFVETRSRLGKLSLPEFRAVCRGLARGAVPQGLALEALSLLRDRRYDPGPHKRSHLLHVVDAAIEELLDAVAPCPEGEPARGWVRADASMRERLEKLEAGPGTVLVLDCSGFAAEGERSASRAVVSGHARGVRRFVLYRCLGHRFLGCGLGPSTHDVHIEVYGSSGDYLGSGLDGATMVVHGNAQDQVGQILKDGTLVIHGDVGQTFLYGAKGGVAYVLGNAAGRPLINAVGRIRCVINGTCLDYCAESFMAGADTGGGFVIINGLRFGPRGEVLGLDVKYPGSNFFSLASGGAGYVSDPYHTMGEEQLNGAKFVDFTQEDWNVILPFLEENERLFGITIRDDLQVVDGAFLWPKEIYRKVVARRRTATLDWSAIPE